MGTYVRVDFITLPFLNSILVWSNYECIFYVNNYLVLGDLFICIGVVVFNI
jgi:hypothetical protein